MEIDKDTGQTAYRVYGALRQAASEHSGLRGARELILQTVSQDYTAAVELGKLLTVGSIAYGEINIRARLGAFTALELRKQDSEVGDRLLHELISTSENNLELSDVHDALERAYSDGEMSFAEYHPHYLTHAIRLLQFESWRVPN